MAWALAAYVTALPLFRPHLAVAPGLKTLLLADVAFLVLALVLLASGTTCLRPLRRGLLAGISLPLVALAWSALANHAVWACLPELLRVSYSLILFAILAHLRLREAEATRVARIWLGSATAVALLGIASSVAVSAFGAPVHVDGESSVAGTGLRVDFRFGLVRTGSLLEVNALSLYLEPSLAFLLFLVGREASPRARRLLAVSLGILLLAAVLTFSRGIAGILVSLAAVAVAGRGLSSFLQSRWLLASAAAAAMAVVALSCVYALVPVRLERQEGGLRLQVSTQPSGRSILGRAALRMAAAHPWLGVGPGQFTRLVTEFTSAEERGSAWRTAFPSEAHSTWLRWLAETGIVGLAAWLGAYLAILRPLLVAPAGTNAPSLGRLMALCFMGTLADGFSVDFTHLKFVWAALGLAHASSSAPGTSASVPRG